MAFDFQKVSESNYLLYSYLFNVMAKMNIGVIYSMCYPVAEKCHDVLVQARRHPISNRLLSVKYVSQFQIAYTCS